MFTLRRIVRYGFIGGSVLGTGISLHHNNYDINGIGIVRFARAGVAVVEIASIYRRELYFQEWDKSTKAYRDQRSIAHQKAADRVLELCCLNRGVYIKVGQHIGALEYLLPIEFVNTMKILHSKAPSNTLEEIYRVIRQDLRRDVSKSYDTEANSAQIGTSFIILDLFASRLANFLNSRVSSHSEPSGNEILRRPTQKLVYELHKFWKTSISSRFFV